MERRANIQQHPHQESRKGFPLYASHTRMKSSANESKDFQSFKGSKSQRKHPEAIKRYSLPFRDDEDSDERTLYFGTRRKHKGVNQK